MDSYRLADVEIPPAEFRDVVNEHAQLPSGVPDRWLHGWHLSGTMSDYRSQDDTPVPGALVPGSVRVASESKALRADIDYLLDEQWSALTRLGDWSGPARISYRYRLLRVDAIVKDGTGRLTTVQGRSHLSRPQPPVVSGEHHVANVFVAGDERIILPITERKWSPVSSAQPDSLSNMMALQESHARPLRITCWGDSVTAGGSSSSSWSAFPQMIERSMNRGGTATRVRTVAVGGTNTSQWLGDADAHLALGRVAETAPDVLVVEFVNDAGLEPEEWSRNYGAIAEQCRLWRCDLVLTTPHFVYPKWMGHQSITESDNRPYVSFLRRFCAYRGIALADVSRSWERLWRFGLPYPSLLSNGINHPDDRGHEIYAREILAALGAPFVAADDNEPADRDSSNWMAS